MKRGGTAAVVLGAVGVVFGDIGTSPLYTLRTVFAPEHGLDPGREQVYGVVSLIIWAITRASRRSAASRVTRSSSTPPTS